MVPERLNRGEDAGGKRRPSMLERAVRSSTHVPQEEAPPVSAREEQRPKEMSIMLRGVINNQFDETIKRAEKPGARESSSALALRKSPGPVAQHETIVDNTGFVPITALVRLREKVTTLIEDNLRILGGHVAALTETVLLLRKKLAVAENERARLQHSDRVLRTTIDLFLTHIADGKPMGDSYGLFNRILEEVQDQESKSGDDTGTALRAI